MSETGRPGDQETRRQESIRAISRSPRLPVSLSTLVIGYGNELRGDDAVGPLAAAAVAAWEVAGVQALAVQQLTPELAETLAAAEVALFVDARVPAPGLLHQDGEAGDAGEAEVLVEPIEAATVDTALGHTGDPRALLALAAALYGRCPQAWSITVPARSFAFGAALSPAAERGLAMALQQIREMIAETHRERDPVARPAGG